MKRPTRHKTSKKKPAKQKITGKRSKKKLKKRKALVKNAGDIRVFKYRPVNKFLIDSLVKSQLHFSLPTQLNDPYDCQVDLKKAIQRAADNSGGPHEKSLRKLLASRKVVTDVRRLVRKTGVCSFSNSILNSVLWSHYADDHRGVGLLYDIPITFISDASTDIVGYSGIEYGDDTLTNWLETTPVKIHPDYLIEILKMMLTIKGTMWKYEGESRILRSKGGQLDIDESYLTQISFGLRTTKSDEKLVRKIVEGNYSKTRFTKMVVDDSDFGLTIVDS